MLFMRYHNNRYVQVGIGISMCLILAGVSYVHLRTAAYAREDAAFASYKTQAEKYEDAAYLPASPTNPVRQNLNKVLSEILSRKMSDAERLRLAQQGNALIAQSEDQIDAIGDAGKPVEEAIARMENDTHRIGQFTPGSNSMTAFLTLAKKESSLIADIRGLSYRANYETKKIFDRIITDKGALTQAHIADLNAQVPEVEKQFNQRSNLYSQLQETSAEIHQILVKGGFE